MCSVLTNQPTNQPHEVSTALEKRKKLMKNLGFKLHRKNIKNQQQQKAHALCLHSGCLRRCVCTQMLIGQDHLSVTGRWEASWCQSTEPPPPPNHHHWWEKAKNRIKLFLIIISQKFDQLAHIPPNAPPLPPPCRYATHFKKWGQPQGRWQVYVTPLSDAEPGPEDFFINFFF